MNLHPALARGLRHCTISAATLFVAAYSSNSVSGRVESTRNQCAIAAATLVDGVAWLDATNQEPLVMIVLANHRVHDLQFASAAKAGMAFLPLHKQYPDFTKLVLTVRADGSEHSGGAALDAGHCTPGFSQRLKITSLDRNRIAGHSVAPPGASSDIAVEFRFDLPIQRIGDVPAAALDQIALKSPSP